MPNPYFKPLAFAGVLMLIGGTMILCGCLSPSQEAAVQSAIAANQVKIASYCMTDIEPILNDPLVTLGTNLNPTAAQTVAVFKNICDPANLATVSLSASTLAYLAANKVNITSNGKEVAPVIAPVPITASSVATTSP